MKAHEFAGLVPECCSEVLDAMYFTTLLDPVSLQQVPEVAQDPGAPLAFRLRFAGDVSGQFGICLELAAARSLAAKFLGEQDSSISSIEVGEVAGELANMLCGSVMSRVEGEHKFVLSHPEASVPPRFPSVDDMFVCRLETDCGAITVWIAIEEDPCHP